MILTQCSLNWQFPELLLLKLENYVSLKLYISGNQESGLLGQYQVPFSLEWQFEWSWLAVQNGFEFKIFLSLTAFISILSLKKSHSQTGSAILALKNRNISFETETFSPGQKSWYPCQFCGPIYLVKGFLISSRFLNTIKHHWIDSLSGVDWRCKKSVTADRSSARKEDNIIIILSIDLINIIVVIGLIVFLIITIIRSSLSNSTEGRFPHYWPATWLSVNSPCYLH